MGGRRWDSTPDVLPSLLSNRVLVLFMLMMMMMMTIICNKTNYKNTDRNDPISYLFKQNTIPFMTTNDWLKDFSILARGCLEFGSRAMRTLPLFQSILYRFHRVDATLTDRQAIKWEINIWIIHKSKNYDARKRPLRGYVLFEQTIKYVMGQFRLMEFVLWMLLSNSFRCNQFV